MYTAWFLALTASQQTNRQKLINICFRQMNPIVTKNRYKLGTKARVATDIKKNQKSALSMVNRNGMRFFFVRFNKNLKFLPQIYDPCPIVLFIGSDIA